MHRRRTVVSKLLIVSSLLVASNLFAQQELIQKRKDLMNENYDAVKAVKRAVEEKDYATVALKARDLMGQMDKVLDAFPKGSAGEKSRAKPEIWEKWDQFSKLPVKVKDVASALAKAAAAKDEAAVQTQFQALGGRDAPFKAGPCFDCHKDFFRFSTPATTKSGG